MRRKKKSDPAHEETDRLIAEMEKRISKEYRQAHKEVSAKMDDYVRRYQKKNETWLRWVEEGKKTKGEYRKWATGQVLMGQRWDDLKDQIADEYVNAHKIAESVVNGYMPEVYAVNHNYGTFLVEHESGIDTSYTLYNRQSVERLLRENPKLYKKPGEKVMKDIRDGKLKRWEKQRIQSVMVQGILQGESIPNLTKRLKSVTGGEHAAAIRNARTMATGVQNAGRLDAYKRANEMGIKTQKTWVATLDSRTRHEHRELDGQTVDVDQPFEVDDEKIMYPGDPEAEGYLIYNCRCTMITQIKGHEIDTRDRRLSYSDEFESMTYDEWKEAKKSHSKPITSQEEKGEAYRWKYIREYRS